ncbi:MAG TPA: hypothetical protein VIV12_25605 [Streptosporangiaceae bacterium]
MARGITTNDLEVSPQHGWDDLQEAVSKPLHFRRMIKCPSPGREFRIVIGCDRFAEHQANTEPSRPELRGPP